jgi:histidinol-phosphate/aromatic aminotransferase/cobyric acid decarboxylase-like protein
VPESRAHAPAPRPDERTVTEALARLRAGSGSHSPSVAEVERAIPGLVQVDACFLSNPYATDALLARMRTIGSSTLERMVSHYPSHGAAIAAMLSSYVGVPADQLYVGNGACEILHALLADAPGPLLLSLPTFSAYYEFATGPVIAHRLDPNADFRLDFDELETLVDRHAPETVVVINPNNPDGGPVAHAELVQFIARMHGRTKQVIVDESFSHFTTEQTPPTLAPLVAEHPHLVVVNSLSKSHGIAGLRLGYAVMTPRRARRIASTRLWNINAFAEWFCGLLNQPDYLHAYETARRRYVQDTRKLFAELREFPGVRTFPSAANFALLELDRPADQVAGALLARHGVYTRDCADKKGLETDKYLRVAARNATDNARIITSLRDVLGSPPSTPVVD